MESQAVRTMPATRLEAPGMVLRAGSFISVGALLRRHGHSALMDRTEATRREVCVKFSLIALLILTIAVVYFILQFS